MIFAQITYDQLFARLTNDLASTGHIQIVSGTLASLAPDWLRPWLHLIFNIGIVIAVLFLAWLSIYTVPQQHIAVIERFGKFNRIAQTGLRFKVPFIESHDEMSLMLEQHTLKFESLTKDKVTVTVYATIQYRVVKEKEFDAYYLLDDPADQLQRFFLDIMRSQIPVRSLDELYEVKDTLSNSVTEEIAKDMEQFGYLVPRVLITAIDPDAKVKAAMNDINAALRESMAAVSRGDAAKTLQVKAAEAQAESDKLRGTGIANQRIEIAKGLKQSVDQMRLAVPDASGDQLTQFLALIQYMETLERIGNQAGRVVVVPWSAGGMMDMKGQIMQAMAGDRGGESENFPPSATFQGRIMESEKKPT